jgi:hypothetical protein
MATKAQISRALAAAVSVFQRAGIKPHVWIDPQGCAHVVEDDGLTPKAEGALHEEENDWRAACRNYGAN